MDAWQAMGAGLVGLCIGLVLMGLSRISASRVVRPLHWFVVTVVFWAFGELVATGADDMAQKQIGLAFLYGGAIFLPTCWWTLAVRWAQEVEGRERLRSRLWLRAPLLWAGAMALAAVGNPWHGEFLTPVLGGRNLYGPLWWVMAVPNYALITAAAVLVIQVLRRVSRPAVRWQGIVLISSSGLTLFCHFVYLLGSEVRPLTTLLVFAAAAAILAIGMYREGLFGVLPAALPVIFEHDQDGLLVVRPGGRLVHCNPRARELLAPVALGVDARIPKDLPSLVPAADRRPIDGSANDPGVLWWSGILRPGGQLYRYGPDAARFLQVSGHAVRGRGDRLVALVLRVRDVTAEQEANTALQRARRLESVAELARGVAHDFHNMLGVVRGNAAAPAAGPARTAGSGAAPGADPAFRRQGHGPGRPAPAVRRRFRPDCDVPRPERDRGGHGRRPRARARSPGGAAARPLLLDAAGLRRCHTAPTGGPEPDRERPRGAPGPGRRDPRLDGTRIRGPGCVSRPRPRG